MKFDELIEIAKRLNLNPDTLLELLFAVGIMVMNQTIDYLEVELEKKLKEIFPNEFDAIRKEDYHKLVKILKSTILNN